MTQFEVPPLSTIPSDDLDDSNTAFKIINQDNLPIIIGESIFKPFGKDGQKFKPNGIVFPTRRITGNLEDNRLKHLTKSNGYIDAQNVLNLHKNVSISHGNLNHCNSAVKDRTDKHKLRSLDNTFTKALDAKLRKLQKDDKQTAGMKSKTDTPRKPFITTVKKGHFLDPPPEIACLFGFKVEPVVSKEKKLYAYASQPRVLHKAVDEVHKSKCEAASKAANCLSSPALTRTQRGEHVTDFNGNTSRSQGDAPVPYANLMFEKRVIRGSNFAHPMQTLRKWNPNFAYAKLLSNDTSEGEAESAASRAAEARRRALARRKAQKQQIRGAQLRIGSPPPVPGRKHEPVQTELYLEEIWSNPPVNDTWTQTDLFLERPISPFYVPAKTGADVATQIYPGDLFDFDMEVQPILEVLVGKTIEQALIEVLEEEELAALREQQRRFLEIRAAETAEAQRLQERERRLQAEKQRRMLEYEEGLQYQKEMEERIAAAVLMQGYMADLLPSVLEGLEEEGFLADNVKKDLDESFMPWLMKEVTTELQEMVSSRDVLIDIVREILENRAELYKALNTEKLEEEEEEGDETQPDISLIEHLKLKEALGDTTTT
ncbi:radial spoke head protein 3 homolog isoform X2 [Photinus pyralis]|uniref:radial spoke head protein 3 homolog isoform X2 n=1 Tax=Photinus pyralis TaxID=7054 RepID=UPI00126727B9|nr:radial spoke head protein 3 homolog isoform X2 [Photinus pyralis]